MVLTRQLLLSPRYRNRVLSLEQVKAYGYDRYGDPDHIKIYNMVPDEWYGKGVRLLGRMAVECTRDPLGNFLFRELQGLDEYKPEESASTVALDPFAGSCNALLWAKKAVHAAQTIGFESKLSVYEIVKSNLKYVKEEVKYLCGDYRSLSCTIPLFFDCRLVIFLSPPWGPALCNEAGLDLCRTTPPVPFLIDFFVNRFKTVRSLLFVVQIHESMVAESLELTIRLLKWSKCAMEPDGVVGHRSGFLIGAPRDRTG
jgi:hypothetical protein